LQRGNSREVELTELQNKRSSLKLFALTMMLEYIASITDLDAYFDSVLKSIKSKVKNKKQKLPDGVQYGLEKGTMKSIQTIDEENDRCPYVWRLLKILNALQNDLLSLREQRPIIVRRSAKTG
jgi:hypothetical protein